MPAPLPLSNEVNFKTAVLFESQYVQTMEAPVRVPAGGGVLRLSFTLYRPGPVPGTFTASVGWSILQGDSLSYQVVEKLKNVSDLFAKQVTKSILIPAGVSTVSLKFSFGPVRPLEIFLWSSLKAFWLSTIGKFMFLLLCMQQSVNVWHVKHSDFGLDPFGSLESVFQKS
jgi:hypothetical protein